jgi:hypothetical protein
VDLIAVAARAPDGKHGLCHSRSSKCKQAW